LAACRWLSALEDANGRAPYFEDCGSPVLMVERGTSAQLLDIGRATVELVALPELGTVWLGGQSWPMAGDSYLSALRQVQMEHAGCVNNCGPRRSHLVGIRVEDVEVSDPITGLVEAVDLDEYLAATPDPIISHSLDVRTHLNAAHHEELMVLASRLVGTPPERLMAASLEWIDAWGLEMAVIDDDGADTHRIAFRVPLTTMDDLGGRLHQLLNRSGGDPC
jgi:hypothetical protein